MEQLVTSEVKTRRDANPAFSFCYGFYRIYNAVTYKKDALSITEIWSLPVQANSRICHSSPLKQSATCPKTSSRAIASFWLFLFYCAGAEVRYGRWKSFTGLPDCLIVWRVEEEKSRCLWMDLCPPGEAMVCVTPSPSDSFFPNASCNQRGNKFQRALL